MYLERETEKDWSECLIVENTPCPRRPVLDLVRGQKPLSPAKRSLAGYSNPVLWPTEVNVLTSPRIGRSTELISENFVAPTYKFELQLRASRVEKDNTE